MIGMFADTPVEKPRAPVSQQSYMALLSARSPLALYVDLNGDGVRGDWVDGLLFNMFFEDSNQHEVQTSEGTRSTIKPNNRNKAIEDQVRKGLVTQRIALIEPTSRGTTALSAQDIFAILDGREKATEKDKSIVLASILNLITLNPALAGLNSPTRAEASQEVQQRTTHLMYSLMRTKRLNQPFRSGGSALAMDVTLSRLALFMSLVEEQLQNPSAQVHPITINNMRAALYFTAFEIKRLKRSAKAQEAIVKEVAKTLAEITPLAVKLAAENASSPQVMAELEKSIISLTPVLNKKGFGRKTIVAASVVANASVLSLWMIGGQWAVETMTSNIGVQTLAHPVISAGAMFLPVSSLSGS